MDGWTNERPSTRYAALMRMKFVVTKLNIQPKQWMQTILPATVSDWPIRLAAPTENTPVTAGGRGSDVDTG